MKLKVQGMEVKQGTIKHVINQSTLCPSIYISTNINSPASYSRFSLSSMYILLSSIQGKGKPNAKDS